MMMQSMSSTSGEGSGKMNNSPDLITALLTKLTNHPAERETKFHPVRKWRFDYSVPDIMLAIEIEGGVWMKKARHTSPQGYIKDMGKYNAAALCGWTVLRFVPNDLKGIKDAVKEYVRKRVGHC